MSLILIPLGLFLVVLPLIALKDRTAGRLSFGIGIVTFGFGLLAYIR